MAENQGAVTAAMRTEAQGGMRRRGLVAGAAALVAGLMVREAAEARPVGATQGAAVLAGVTNTATASTIVSAANGFTNNATVLFGTASGVGTFANGVGGNGAGAGSGVIGFGGPQDGVGVQGIAGGNGNGVVGMASSGIGVFGVNQLGGPAPFGVVGSVNTAPGFALYGIVNVAGAVGFAAGAGVAGAIAGQFSGPVNIFNTGAVAPGNLFIQGNYTASGTKSAAVPHPDGSHRLLYCMESPEAWFEDFGTGTITAGKAEVKLDTDFAAVVDTSTMHVFPVAHDEHHTLHVAGKSATGFTVGAVPSTTGAAAGKKTTDLSGTFSYRVVAKRRDVKAERLAKFDIPKEIKATPPPLPPLPKK